MEIIELYGFSASGKSYKAKKIAKKKKLNSNFLKISKKFRLIRFFYKIFFIYSIQTSDLIFISKIHKFIKFNGLIGKSKSIFSYLYVIGFIRYYKKNNQSIIIDHGLFQCLFGSFLRSPNNMISDIHVANLFTDYLKFLFKNSIYEIIEMKTNLKIVNKRLIKDKNYQKLKFLKKNRIKIIDTYFRISFILKNYIKINFNRLNFK
jgi:hypothetical protein